MALILRSALRRPPATPRREHGFGPRPGPREPARAEGGRERLRDPERDAERDERDLGVVHRQQGARRATSPRSRRRRARRCRARRAFVLAAALRPGPSRTRARKGCRAHAAPEPDPCLFAVSVIPEMTIFCRVRLRREMCEQALAKAPFFPAADGDFCAFPC